MIELPEAQTLARQMKEVYAGKIVTHVEALRTPHGFAFFRGEPQGYAAALEGLRANKELERQVRVLVADILKHWRDKK